MGTIFFKVMEMSIAALLLMVAVALIRIPLKRAPKWFMGILWAIVALRLLVPVQVTAHVGFMPDFGNIVKACFDQEKEAEEGPITVNSGIYEAVGITKSVVNESADAEPMQGVDAADVKTADAKAADAKTKDSSKGILDVTTPSAFWNSPLSQSFLRTVYVVDFFQPNTSAHILTSSPEPTGSFSHISSANFI